MSDMPDTSDPARRNPAEEARTLVAATNVGSLATLTADGDPWASYVTYGVLEDGSPVMWLSTLAEHGRNLEADARASLVVVTPDPPGDPLAAGRVTLAGRAVKPAGAGRDAARAAHIAAHPGGAMYEDFHDFSLWVLQVDRVRWVGGYGRMDSADAGSYRDAEPDPVARDAAGAVAHLNEDHADSLLTIAQTLGGQADATAARCTGADRYGLDLRVAAAGGSVDVRVAFAAAATAGAGLRPATVELTHRARALAT